MATQSAVNWHRVVWITIVTIAIFNQGCFERRRNCSVVVAKLISTCED